MRDGTASELSIIALWGACCAAFGALLGWWAVLGLLLGSFILVLLTYEASE